MSMTQFEYQLDFLKVEIETINNTIRQMDDITKSVKEWAIVAWTGAVGGALVKAELTKYVGLTAVIPLLFWLVDTWHRRIQRKFIWRSIEISKFLNDDQGRLTRSFAAQRLVDFKVLDPKGRLAKGEKYEEFISWYRVMLFRSLSILYGGLTGISLLLWLLYGCKVLP